MLDKGVGTGEYYELYYSSRDWEVYKTILSQILLCSKPGSILDVGAGVGFLTEAASRWGFDCRGIEGSPEAIQIAKKRCSGIRLEQHFLSERFPFEDHTFQTVIMNQVIEHLEPKVAENAAEESYRVLQPGGALLINSPSKFNVYEKTIDATHINMYAPKELKKLLLDSGFTQITAANSALNLLGDSLLGRKTMSFVFKLTEWDRLSATANCIAYKPISLER